MRCDLCRHRFAPHETVRRYFFTSRTRARSGLKTVCVEDCGPSPLLGQRWLAPRPCCVCNRPVVWSGRRKPAAVFVCSGECQYSAYLDLAKQRRGTPKPRACENCSTTFVPSHSHARFCSNACRQSAYRQRLAAA